MVCNVSFPAGVREGLILLRHAQSVFRFLDGLEICSLKKVQLSLASGAEETGYPPFEGLPHNSNQTMGSGCSGS